MPVTLSESGLVSSRPLGLKGILVTSRAGLTSEPQTVQVLADQTATADFKLAVAPIFQEITVTATGLEQAAFESFQVVSTLDAFNLDDRLYFNHLSLIKDVAPEIGRGVRVTYSVKFF